MSEQVSTSTRYQEKQDRKHVNNIQRNWKNSESEILNNTTQVRYGGIQPIRTTTGGLGRFSSSSVSAFLANIKVVSSIRGTKNKN